MAILFVSLLTSKCNSPIYFLKFESSQNKISKIGSSRIRYPGYKARELYNFLRKWNYAQLATDNFLDSILVRSFLVFILIYRLRIADVWGDNKWESGMVLTFAVIIITVC